MASKPPKIHSYQKGWPQWNIHKAAFNKPKNYLVKDEIRLIFLMTKVIDSKL